MSKIYYNQADSRWASHPYPSSLYPKANMKSAGCGPTAGAMIISSLKEIVRPDTIADLFKKTGYRAATGTDGKGFLFLAEKYGLKCHVQVKLDNAVTCLKRGGMVIANVKGGSVFSTGGHYIVLAGMKDDNTIIVFDPYMYSNKFNIYGRANKVKVDGNTVYISYLNMKEYGKYSYLYCFEPTEVKAEPSKFKAGQELNLNKNIGVAFVEGDFLGVDPLDGQNQFKINKEYVKNNKIIEKVIIAYAAGKRYIIDLDGLQFWVNENELSEIEIKEPIKSTVNQVKRLRTAVVIYENSNLTGKTYNYKSNTTVKVLENINNDIDKVKVIQTGRVGYIKNNQYK